MAEQEPPYSQKIYGIMKQLYGDKFTHTPESFEQKLNSDTAYVNKVYGIMREAYGNQFTHTSQSFADKLKKKGVTTQGSGQPVQQPGKPSAPSFGQKVVSEATTQEIQIPLKGKQKPPVEKRPYQDIYYKPEEMPSETVQATARGYSRTIPDVEQENKNVELQISKGEIPKPPKNPVLKEIWNQDEIDQRVNEKRKELGIKKTVEEEREDVGRKMPYMDLMIDYEDELDDYIAYGGNGVSNLSDEDIELASGSIFDYKKIQEEGGVAAVLEKKGLSSEKQATVFNNVMGDYWSYMSKKYPDGYALNFDKYQKLKSKKVLTDNDEQFLSNVESRAFGLYNARIANQMIGLKKQMDDDSKVLNAVNLKKYNEEINKINDNIEILNKKYQAKEITDQAYQNAFQGYQEQFKKLEIETGVNDDTRQKIARLQDTQKQLGKQALALNATGQTISNQMKLYPGIMQEYEEQEANQKMRDEFWASNPNILASGAMAGYEAAKGFSDSIAKMFISSAAGVWKAGMQAGPLFFATDKDEYDMTDIGFDAIMNAQTNMISRDYIKTNDSTIATIANLAGSGLGSATAFIFGGEAALAMKAPTWLGVFLPAYLSQEADLYNELVNTGKYNPAEASLVSNAVAIPSAAVELIVPDVPAARGFGTTLTQSILKGDAVGEAFRASVKSYATQIMKEGGEEGLAYIVENIQRNAVNAIGQQKYLEDKFSGKEFQDAVLGGMIVGGVMNKFRKFDKKRSPTSESAEYEIVKRGEDIIQAHTGESTLSTLKSELKKPMETLTGLEAHPNWNKLDDPKKAHIFAITRDIEELEGSKVQDPIIKAQIQKLKTEREEILALGTNGIDAKTVGTSTAPQRVMIGGGPTAEQNRELEVLNQKKSEFSTPKVARLIAEEKVPRDQAEGMVNEEWSNTPDGKRREELMAQTQGEQAYFYINEEGDYEIQYNNGRSVIIPKGEGAAEKIRLMGIKTDEGEVSGVVKENQNTLITPTLEKGATVDYNGKNATVNGFKEKDGKVVYVNITTEDGRNLQIREGQVGPGQELLNNLNKLGYDQENQVRVSSEVGVGQKPVAAEPVEAPSAETPEAGGILQAQEEIAPPTDNQIFDDIKNKRFATFTYNSEAEVPNNLKNKISSRGEINGKPFVKVTLAQSEADYEIAKAAQEEVDPKKAAVEKAQKQLDGLNSQRNPKANHPIFNVGQKHSPGNNLIVINSEDRRTDTTKDGVEVITKIISPAELDENGRMTKAAEVEIGTFDSYEQGREYVNSRYDKNRAVYEERLSKANAELASPEATPTTEAAPESAPAPKPSLGKRLRTAAEAAETTVTVQEPAPVKEEKEEGVAPAPKKEKKPTKTKAKAPEIAPAPRRAGAVEASEGDNPIAGAENTLAAVGMNETSLNEWKKANEKDSQKGRIEELAELVRNLMSGKIKFKNYYEKAKQLMPSKLMDKVPAIASFKEIAGSIDRNKLEKGIVNLNKFIKKGTRVGLRIDIPAFNRFGKNVVTVHEGTGRRSPIGYGSTGSISNVTFRTSVSTAAKIGSGKSKEAFAMAEGEWLDESPESIQARAEEALNSPEWIQVGMNPTRSSFFFDKADGNPVVAADEVLQVGNLVLAKNPQKIDLNTKEGMAQFEKMFSAKTKEGVTYQYRRGSLGQRLKATFDTAGERAAEDIARFLEESGIDVQIIDSVEAERIGQERNIEGSIDGIFFADKDSGIIYLNKDSIKGKDGATIAYHEGIHPVINIIRNTNPELYGAIVAGIREEAKRNPAVARVIRQIESVKEYQKRGPETIEDETIVEVLARIAAGDIDINKVDKSLKDSLIDFWNRIAKTLGIPQVKANPTSQEFRDFADKLSTALTQGGTISDVVGEENVMRYENNLAEESGSIETGSVVYAGQASVDIERGDKIENPYRDSVNLPARTLQSLLEEYGDNVIVVNSDPTGLGTVRLPSGKVIELDGGIGYMAIQENIDAGVGFASSSDARVNFLYKTANQMNEDGKLKNGKVLVLVMVQKADSMLGNNYTPDYVADALAKIPQDAISKEKLTNLLVEPLKKETFKSFFYKESSIPKMKPYKNKSTKTPAENKKLKEAYIKKYNADVAKITESNAKKKAEGLAKINAIEAEIRAVDPRTAHDDMVRIFHELSFVQAQKYFDSILGSYTNKTTKYNLEISRLLYQYAGADQKNLFQVLGEKSLVDQLLKDPKSWGYAVAAFVHDTAKQKQKLGGIKHNLFNAKFQGDERYILAEAHKVNDIMTEFNTEQVRKVEEGGKKGAVFAEQQASQGMYPSGKAVIPSAKGVELESLQMTKGRFQPQKPRGQASVDIDRSGPEGQPLTEIDGQTTFFHASSKKREGRLKPNMAPQWGKAIYFATSRQAATDEFGGDNVTEASLNLKKPAYTNTKDFREINEKAAELYNREMLPNILKEEAELVNGKWNFFDEDLQAEYDKNSYINRYSSSDIEEGKYFGDAAKELGYDAIIDEGGQYGTEIAVLDENAVIYPEDIESAVVLSSEDVKNSNIELKKQNIRGRLLNNQQAAELQAEIESNYTTATNVFDRSKDDIRQKMFSYDEPYVEANINGVNVRIADGLIRTDKNGKREKTYLIYADGKVAGEFYSKNDAIAVVKYIEDNLIKGLEPASTKGQLSLIDRSGNDIGPLIEEAADAVEQAIASGTAPQQALDEFIGSQEWYSDLTPAQRKQIDDILQDEFGVTPKAPKAKPTGVKAKIQNIVDNYYKLREGSKDEKRAAKAAINEILDADPKLKYIYNNISNINKELQAAGLITDKTDGCP
jgi:hypothetical protein